MHLPSRTDQANTSDSSLSFSMSRTKGLQEAMGPIAGCNVTHGLGVETQHPKQGFWWSDLICL